uniref:Uncharacterized protein n=1 Tax=Alexandrium monilatum TaxID=311494 RepID=A0A7S4PT13_9DINO
MRRPAVSWGWRGRPSMRLRRICVPPLPEPQEPEPAPAPGSEGWGPPTAPDRKGQPAEQQQRSPKAAGGDGLLSLGLQGLQALSYADLQVLLLVRGCCATGRKGRLEARLWEALLEEQKGQRREEGCR